VPLSKRWRIADPGLRCRPGLGAGSKRAAEAPGRWWRKSRQRRHSRQLPYSHQNLVNWCDTNI
jgi:hypothetical protein